MVVENWRPIGGHEGYEVSDLGNLRSSWVLGAKPARMGGDWRALKQTTDEIGRRVVNLRKTEGGHKVRRVHQLVAETFIGPRPEGAVTCHNDGDNTNNRASNLRYDTMLGNMHDKYAHGTHNIGARNPMCKLNEDAVRDIRQRFVRQHSLTRFKSWKSNAAELAAAYGVSATNILNIARGDSWSHVDGNSLGGNVGRRIKRDRLEKIERRERSMA